MDSERWRVVRAVFDDLVELEPAARAQRLATLDATDPELRLAMEALLEADAAAEERLAGRMFGLPASASPPEEAVHEHGRDDPLGLTGRTLSHFRVLAPLGSGGMGVVYAAEDTRLGRPVALKLPLTDRWLDSSAKQRFLQEARAAGALDHPNLCSVYEVGETEDGLLFLAMALYRGETLKARLAREGRLEIPDALAIARQIAQGLAAAHQAGIMHRDLKPGNVMLLPDGPVKILDFGLAKARDHSVTGPGAMLGTIAYMSPEQGRGGAVDARTDLWSLGVVLYEMLAGERPFLGGNDRAVIQAILHERPGPLRERRAGTPGWLARTVERLLEKERGRRYGSADELLRDLTATSPAERVAPRRRWRPALRPTTVGGASVLALVGLLYLGWSENPSNASEATGGLAPQASATVPAPASAPAPAIAVLPFTVRGEGLDLWREGMVDLLSMGLDGAGGLRAIHSRTVLARWSEEVGGGSVADLARALDVARRTQARYALVGSAVAAGRQVRLAADVYDLTGGHSLGQAQVEGPPDSILALVDRLGMQTVGVIREKEPGEFPPMDVARVTTTSLVALKAYLEGEARFRRSEYRRASEAWERAVRADSLFALAYLGLAEAYGWHEDKSHDPSPGRYWENLERAWIMAARLPGLERLVVQARWGGYTGVPEALPTIREAVRKYPDAAAAWYALGEVYYHQPVALAGPEQAADAFRRAAELQPMMAPYRAHLLDLAFLWHPDSARIARELGAFSRLAPEGAKTRAGRIAHALAFGGTGARARARVELVGLNPESAIEVYLFLAHPRFAEVREAVDSAIEPHLDQRSRAIMRFPRLLNLGLMDGRARHALRTLDGSGIRNGAWYCGPLYLSVRGLPVPEPILEQRLAASRADSALFSNRYSVLCAAGFAALRGKWSEHRALLSRARMIAARDLAAGDSASAREWDWTVRWMEAHSLWRRGRKEEALRAYESTLPGNNDWGTLWPVGQLALELGRLDQAERAFRALWKQDGAAAYLQLARILERTGRPAEAREAYRFVAYAWRNADPELQPMVDEARQAVARLGAAAGRAPRDPPSSN